MKSKFWRSFNAPAGSVVFAGVSLLAGVLLSCSVVAAPGAGPGASLPGHWLTDGQYHEPPAPSQPDTVVLLHGFGGSPWDMKPLFDALAAEGYRVTVPLVPGEGPGAAGVEPPEPQDLVAWMRDLLEAERDRDGRRPHVVGFSKGGALAAIAAAEGLAERVALIAPYFRLSRADAAAEKTGRLVAPVFDSIPKPWKGRINDPEGYERYHPGQKEVSLKGFLQLQELARLAESRLHRPPGIPILVLASPEDDVASFARTRELFSAMPGATVKEYPQSNHVLLYDYDATQIIADILDFLAAGER